MGHLCSSAHPFSLGCRVDYAWTDPCLFPPPPFIFLALTFIEAFQRNTPLAIHFLKWSHGEKACGVGVRMCGIYKRAKRSFIFPPVFFIVLVWVSSVFWFLLFILNPPFPLPPSAFSGMLFSLLNQYSSLVCTNCHAARSEDGLYRFIYERVSSCPATKVQEPSSDSGALPEMLDSQ